jgi:hypothetical protein
MNSNMKQPPPSGKWLRLPEERPLHLGGPVQGQTGHQGVPYALTKDFSKFYQREVDEITLELRRVI